MPELSDLTALCDQVDAARGDAKKEAKSQLRQALKAADEGDLRDLLEGRDGRKASSNVIRAHLAKLDKGVEMQVQASVAAPLDFGTPEVAAVSGLLDRESLIRDMVVRAGAEAGRLEAKKLYSAIRVACLTAQAIYEIMAENGGELPPWNNTQMGWSGPLREDYDGSLREIKEPIKPAGEVTPAGAPRPEPAEVVTPPVDADIARLRAMHRPGVPTGLAVSGV